MPTSKSNYTPRAVCPTCQRPEKVCLCQWIQPVANRVEVGILQHPNEVAQIKGTAKIAELSLQNCRVWVGEDFTDEATLHSWLASGEVFLLYPEIEALKQVSGVSSDFLGDLSYQVEAVRAGYSIEKIKLLILDGTWRKTHKMMMQNSFLHGLKRLQLNPQTPSAYKIRKQRDAGSLSTVEAIYLALSQLELSEPEAGKFEPLLEAFEKMVAQQLAFRSKPSV